VTKLADKFPQVALGEAVLVVAQMNMKLAGNVTKGDVVIASAHQDDDVPTVVIGTDQSAKFMGIAMKTGVTGDSIPVLTIGIIKVTAGAGTVILGEEIECAANGAVENTVGGATVALIIGRGLQTLASGDTGIVWINASRC